MINVSIPSSVTSIGSRAFWCCGSLLNLTIQDEVTSIGEDAFTLCNNDFVIYGYSGSYVERYAKNNGIQFESIGVSRFSIVNAVISFPVQTYTYTGSALYPEPVVDLLGTTLQKNTDYTVKYSNNMNVGTATVTITGIGNYGGTTTTTFEITKATQSITASNLSLTFPNSGTISVSGNKGELIYNSDNTAVATVDSSGNVTAKGAGTAKIMITAAATDNYNQATKTVTVTVAKATQSITASNLSLTFPNSGKISASGNKGKLTYKSDNTAIATVDSAGKVTAKGAGTAKITITAAATDNYNQATKTITVTVNKAAQSITVKAAASSVAVGKTTTVTLTGNKGSKSFKSSDVTRQIEGGRNGGLFSQILPA